MNPQRILMSRDGSDESHAAMHDVRGLIMQEPHVGDMFQVILDDGRFVRTSPVKRFARKGEELTVETTNSIYRLRPDHN